MKKFFYLILVFVSTFSSCSNDEIIVYNSQNEETVLFTATIEGNFETRATLVGNKPNWEVDDEISIDGHSYNAITAGSTTSFSGSGAIETTHHAYFPASIYNGGTPTLSAEQIFVEGKFNMPMYAESNTENLEFKNICAVLSISVSNEDISQVKAIKVSSSGKALSGAFTMASNGTMTMITPDDASKIVTLTCETPVVMTSEEKVFNIAIPAQEYSDLQIYLSSDGVSFSKCMATKKASGLGTLARNKIYNINYETNAIQLWENGLYYATTNIDAENIEDNGGYYAWGETSTKMNYNYASYSFYHSDTYAFDYLGDISGTDYDVAHTKWGGLWRIPTQNEFEQLQDNCTWTWISQNSVYGYKVMGTNNNWIFLPAAGYYYGTDFRFYGEVGRYWVSTPLSNTPYYTPYTAYVRFSENEIRVGGPIDRSDGYTIRPIYGL